MDLITDLDCAQACADVYPPDGLTDHEKQFAISHGQFNEFWAIDQVYVGLRHLASGADVFAFRGSVSEEDWIRDFEGWPRRHPLLGYCHNGFLENMDDLYDKLLLAVDPARPFAIAGHSLGAARALIMAGIFTARGRPPALVVTFGTPRPGFQQLSGILNSGGFPIRCYRNGPDPVAEVPLKVPPLLLYQKPQADILLGSAPEFHPEDPFRWHSMPLYLEGVRRLASA